MEASISNVGSLLESYRRIQATSNDSPSLTEAKGELRSALQLLETDLEDLDESVRVVEQHGDRWGLAHAEIVERRAFVNSLSSEVAVCPSETAPRLMQAIEVSGRRSLARAGHGIVHSVPRRRRSYEQR